MSGYFKCLIYKITLKVHKFVVPQPCELCFFPPGINRKSPARRPGGFEIRRKKRFDLLKPGDL